MKTARDLFLVLRHQYTRFAVSSRSSETMRSLFRDVPESCARLRTVDVIIIEPSSQGNFLMPQILGGSSKP